MATKKAPETISAFVYNATRSSIDPTALSLTVKGLLTAFIPVILALTRGSIDISASDLTMVIDQIIMFIQAGAAFASALMVAYGSLRKIWASFKK